MAILMMVLLLVYPGFEFFHAMMFHAELKTGEEPMYLREVVMFKDFARDHPT